MVRVEKCPLGPETHVCLLHRGFQEQKAAVLPFIKEGLDKGEQCYYIADERSADDWRFELQAYGINVQEEEKRGSLIVSGAERWRRPQDFSSTANARRFWELIERGLESFNGVRFAIDAGWMLDPEIPTDLICHWEATLNVVIDDGVNVRMLCQYNLGRHSWAGVHSALRTHPTAQIGGVPRPNPYYEAMRILENEPHLNFSNADAGMIEGMLIALSEPPGD
jgi:hypothetical protein